VEIEAEAASVDTEIDAEAAPEPADALEWSSGLRGLRELSKCRSALDALERTLVYAARREGAVWAEIAEQLGVAKQTALRRHRAADPVAKARARAQAADPWLEELAGVRAIVRGERPSLP
jgi:hypothetical protein